VKASTRLPVALVAALSSLVTAPVAAELDLRLKAFGTVRELPDTDAQRAINGEPAVDGNLDLRLLFRQAAGRFEVIADHSTIALAGDTYEAGIASFGTIDQTPTDDDRRALELTWSIDKDDDYRLYHRFDRLALKYRGDDWGFTVGREAVSWGSGKVFNPMDLFSPFSPTTVDRDYKAGDDLVMVDKLFDGGGDIQLLAVFRRDEQGDREADEGSYGIKWRGFAGSAELELAAGQHYEDTIGAVTFRLPIGGALLQTDWVATELDEQDEWKLSGVVNIDYSFLLAERNTYVFAEYFRNGFGRNENRVDLFDLPVYLVERVQRGEVFSLTKDYLAAGGFYEWHPLVNHSLTVLWNLHDDSTLWQTSLSYQPGDRQTLELGVTLTTGSRGDEYGRIDVGEGLTTGGGARAFLRWVYFW
jgi:hypothetical protein